MQLSARVASLVLVIFAGLGVAHADNYDDTITVFKKAGESADFFRRSYAYAVFPTVGEGGFIVGAAIRPWTHFAAESLSSLQALALPRSPHLPARQLEQLARPPMRAER